MNHSPTSSPNLQHQPAPVVILSTTPPNEPPPPYPSRERRQRTVRSGRRRRTLTGETAPGPLGHLQLPSTSSEGYSDYETTAPFPSVEGNEHAYHEATEHTPLLGSTSPRLPAGGIGRRQRTLSVTSTVHSATSFAPSLAHTLISAFHPDRDCDLDPEEAEPLDTDEDGLLDSPTSRGPSEDQQRLFAAELAGSPRLGGGATVRRQGRWRRYFRPMTKKPYYAALCHLLFINFPYALAAAIYLFVLTLTGTTTLMALPLGAVLCLLDLLGARAFARGELYLQTTFHYPLFFPVPNPPMPIFTRTRMPTPTEIEDGIAIRPMKEQSFYKNAYALFTDPTSYMPLFYFLVLKPPLTILLSLFLVCIVPISFVLVLPAPAMLRLVRRLGVWQANIAVEGLCHTTVQGP